MDQKPGRVIVKSILILLSSLLFCYFTILFLKGKANYFNDENNFWVIFLPPVIIFLYTLINNRLIKIFDNWYVVYPCIAVFLSNIFFWNSGYAGILVIALLFLAYLPIKQPVQLRLKYAFFTNLFTALFLYFLFLLSGQSDFLQNLKIKDDWDLLNILQLCYFGFFHFFLVLSNLDSKTKKET